MVPIHDSDVAEERFAQAEWQHYELWEKIEVRLRRRRNLWIAATILVFLALSSIPILTDHWPKWTALRASRALGDQINEIKRMSSTENRSFRIDFSADHSLSYTVTLVPNCDLPAVMANPARIVKRGNLLPPGESADYALVSPEQGRGLGLPGLVESMCYDPLIGSKATPQAESIAGFGIIPVKDLTDGRQDRLSLLIFKGPSAEIYFE
jgi:hypothetical protein